MLNMIDGVLIYLFVNLGMEIIELVDFQQLMEYIEVDVEVVLELVNGCIEMYLFLVVEGVFVLLYQLFYNLVNNFIKFVYLDCFLLIWVVGEDVGEKVKVIVLDNGMGFDDDYLEQIFDIFIWLNLKDQVEGMGLGFLLCKKIVE